MTAVTVTGLSLMQSAYSLKTFVKVQEKLKGLESLGEMASLRNFMTLIWSNR